MAKNTQTHKALKFTHLQLINPIYVHLISTLLSIRFVICENLSVISVVKNGIFTHALSQFFS